MFPWKGILSSLFVLFIDSLPNASLKDMNIVFCNRLSSAILSENT